ncbi:MAG TPA: thiamine pyrophosphate-binding protein [Blastocatellia bacterium]|nr:thiamine pyrophosphate-binding protein [Blastocatellia bacterium]
MRDLVMGYLSNKLSRRSFFRRMTAAGFTTVAAKEMLNSLAPITSAAGPAAQEGDGYKTVQGTGGDLLVEQLQAAGIKFLFVGTSSHFRNVYDALVDRPSMHLILTVEEGQAVAMAAGYAMASDKTGVVACSAAGAPHCTSNMYNARVARLPVMVATDYLPFEYEDQMGLWEGRVMLGVASVPAKWNWIASHAHLIPDVTRRAIKVANTSPGGPVSITYTEDALARKGTRAAIIPQEKFNVPANVKASPGTIEAAARLLLEAEMPAMYVGPEALRSGAQADYIELAELLGIPAMRVIIDSWTDTFPTDHPLFINAEYRPNARFPRPIDVLLVVGHHMPSPISARVIHITTEQNEIGKSHPEEVSILADVKLAARDIIDAIKSMATKERIAAIAGPRIESIHSFNRSMRETLDAVAKANWDSNPISFVRLALELEKVLERDALIIEEVSTEKTKIFSYIRTRAGGRTRMGRSIQQALGWGVGLSIGAKLANPDRQVVTLLGDGAFMFGQAEALWTMSRYDVPVITIILNNRSYNEPRQRIMAKMGKAGETGKDMACYLGSPDVDFAKIATGFGIKGEVVANPGDIRPALERAIRSTRDGRPYLLDVLVARSGIGAESTWYPRYSVAEQRKRLV